MESIGSRLKKIRLEKGISLEEAHRKTKIHLNVLKAIEEDSFVNFNPVYIKGFVKIYCNFLGINQADKFTKESESQQAKIKEDSFVTRLKSESRMSLDIGKGLKIAGRILAAIVILFLIFSLGKFIIIKIKSLPKKALPRAALSSPKKPKAKSPLTQVKKVVEAEPINVKAPFSSASAGNSLGIRLGIRAKEDCWINVKADGKAIFQNILKKGRFESWKAKEKIELSLGNVGVVELEVNGKIMPSLGRRGQALKNILITKEGLSTQR